MISLRPMWLCVSYIIWALYMLFLIPAVFFGFLAWICLNYLETTHNKTI